jgi:hypothetical protein
MQFCQNRCLTVILELVFKNSENPTQNWAHSVRESLFHVYSRD